MNPVSADDLPTDWAATTMQAFCDAIPANLQRRLPQPVFSGTVDAGMDGYWNGKRRRVHLLVPAVAGDIRVYQVQDREYTFTHQASASEFVAWLTWLAEGEETDTP